MVPVVRAVHLPIKVPAEQAVSLRIKEKEVRELLLHLTREQTEGCPQELHQRKEEPEVGEVPLMVLRSHRKRGEEADLQVAKGLREVEREAGEGARLTLQLLALQAEQEVEVVHSILPLLLTVHLRKKVPEEDRLVGEVLLPKVPVELAIHLYLPQYSPTLHRKTGGAGDPRRQAREYLALQGLLEPPKLEVKEQEFLPSLRLPQLGEAGLRLAPRLGLNFLRWGEGKERAILFQLVLAWA
jgi:hypothetical protein